MENVCLIFYVNNFRIFKLFKRDERLYHGLVFILHLTNRSDIWATVIAINISLSIFRMKLFLFFYLAVNIILHKK